MKRHLVDQFYTIYSWVTQGHLHSYDRAFYGNLRFPHLVYLILVERYGSTCYLLSHLHQVFLNVLHNYITTLVRQDLTNHIAGRGQKMRGIKFIMQKKYFRCTVIKDQ